MESEELLACTVLFNKKNTVHLSCAHQHPERSHVHINLNIIFCAHVEHSSGAV